MTTATVNPPAGIDATTRFGSLLLQLVGEPFLFLRRSYGDELVLHFGEPLLGPARPTKHGSFRYEHGTYRLQLRGSAWAVKSELVPSVISCGLGFDLEKVLGAPDQRTDVANELTIAPGARVIALTPFPVTRPGVDGIGLRVDMSDGSCVVVIPTPDDPDPAADLPPDVAVAELADWELNTPHYTLHVGPGRKWHSHAATGTRPE